MRKNLLMRQMLLHVLPTSSLAGCRKQLSHYVAAARHSTTASGSAATNGGTGPLVPVDCRRPESGVSLTPLFEKGANVFSSQLLSSYLVPQ
ncbi:hypothetical protein [Pandoraea anapnoica]|uniref:hypothetical protein n=1 Tax=Pandoraea anapnoica TaxID=2508301 RepID=UPI001242244D|nr:hypothetical protein [Pandoraea anapnoica]